ncbi:hypothetical protein CSAL01_12566 [Colletotrichum salicis]|uniref:Uncharacterized protein n=1 Tax=Colletotrichum salicis TaxID=1209931 RepID=A0A135UZT5_9PEZI|nr:hypothetical protein CSAL01_12566 [Colletotrichum salicis]
MGTSRLLVIGTYSEVLHSIWTSPLLLLLSSRLLPPPTTLDYNTKYLHLKHQSSVNQLTHQRLLMCRSHCSKSTTDLILNLSLTRHPSPLTICIFRHLNVRSGTTENGRAKTCEHVPVARYLGTRGAAPVLEQEPDQVKVQTNSS